MESAVVDLYLMLDKIVDGALPNALKQRARELMIDVPDVPEVVRVELAALAASYSATLPHAVAKTDLYRVIELDVFRRRVAEDSYKSIDAGLFRAYVETQADPAAFLRSIIPANRVVAPAARSWLVDNPRVLAMTARELHTALELSSLQQPPFVLFRFTTARMDKAGVEVRIPNALDAAAGGRVQWEPSGLRTGTEYIDREVTIDAVDEIVWKP